MMIGKQFFDDMNYHQILDEAWTTIKFQMILFIRF